MTKVKEASLWLLGKIVEQKVLPSGLLWAASSLGAWRVVLHQNIPLWLLLVFIVILIPASFGVVTFVRIWTRLNFHVTADPVKSICCDGNWRGQPAVQLNISAMFANGSDYDLLLMYAYINGTKALMHFDEPVHIEPHSAQQETVLFFCTKPKNSITPIYEPKIVFVDAGGRKKSQRLTMTGIPAIPPLSMPTSVLQATTNGNGGSK